MNVAGRSADSADGVRQQIFAYARKTYHTEPAYPWRRFPSCAVLRHAGSRTMYAVLMRVPPEKLTLSAADAPDRLAHSAGAGMEESRSQNAEAIPLDASGRAEVLCVKIADAALHDILLREPGIFPAYHLPRAGWISLFPAALPFARVTELIDRSFGDTEKRRKRESRGPREWLIPASVSYCDPRHFFDEADTVRWTQSSNVLPGDTVYIYAGVPIGALLYRCRAVETDLPAEGVLRRDFRSSRTMILRREAVLDEGAFSRERLKNEFGIYSVRGPRYVPNSLREALDRYLGSFT